MKIKNFRIHDKNGEVIIENKSANIHYEWYPLLYTENTSMFDLQQYITFMEIDARKGRKHEDN